MATAVKDIKVTWDWEGDITAIRGFRIAILKLPEGSTNYKADTEKVSVADVDSNDREYIFENLLLEVGSTYSAWIQAQYLNRGSEWIKSSQDMQIEDADGEKTIVYSRGSIIKGAGDRFEITPNHIKAIDDENNITFQVDSNGEVTMCDGSLIFKEDGIYNQSNDLLFNENGAVLYKGRDLDKGGIIENRVSQIESDVSNISEVPTMVNATFEVDSDGNYYFTPIVGQWIKIGWDIFAYEGGSFGFSGFAQVALFDGRGVARFAQNEDDSGNQRNGIDYLLVRDYMVGKSWRLWLTTSRSDSYAKAKISYKTLEFPTTLQQSTFPTYPNYK